MPQQINADEAGQGGVELRMRQDIMGDHRSSHVLVAEPRFLLVKGHTAAGGFKVLCVTGPTARVPKPRYSHGRAERRSCGHVFRRRTQLARNSMRCFWNGQARTTIQPSPPERGVPGLGGTGLVSSLFLRSGSPL